MSTSVIELTLNPHRIIRRTFRMQITLVCIAAPTVCIMRPRLTATRPACMPLHTYRCDST